LRAFIADVPFVDFDLAADLLKLFVCVASRMRWSMNQAVC
jgi:hypothetical protein